jgi:hypothetical protein
MTNFTFFDFVLAMIAAGSIAIILGIMLALALRSSTANAKSLDCV